ncbi:MAG: hypothetical protein A2648_02460 [Candidatus Lloydbacteria bacterium RIFCSPHIGHO2_01_FULL_41_20]|uniref:Uncharacterized protein n=1 Tax=Candidatus Lloydbacteria bacterium RIFCSPHIGHO2_01_FULL_41_20 TaxID=1798657 RepID=A0A1G2CQY3_9BACT|nr:MAG: hypothetical protein A2648_02460 [Candidatus Lloydbacteria bacterium RIFCSPHIGHO2_01_FULL_41_20]
MNLSEGFPEFKETDPTQYAKNMLQIGLAEEMGIPLEEFVSKYGDKVNKIFNPALMDKLEEAPEKTIAEIKQILH